MSQTNEQLPTENTVEEATGTAPATDPRLSMKKADLIAELEAYDVKYKKLATAKSNQSKELKTAKEANAQLTEENAQLNRGIALLNENNQKEIFILSNRVNVSESNFKRLSTAYYNLLGAIQGGVDLASSVATTVITDQSNYEQQAEQQLKSVKQGG